MVSYRPAGRPDAELLVHRGRHALVLLNRFPYASGSQKMQPGRSSACWTYSSRHGAQRGFGIRRTLPADLL